MSNERPPVDYLAEAKAFAGQQSVNQAVMYALVSIAEDLRGIRQQLADDAENSTIAVEVPNDDTGAEWSAIAIPDPCIICGSEGVTDTEWGWECRTCGSSDVAQGCVKP